MPAEGSGRYAPALLVLERAPRLEPELKRLLASPKLLVRPVRSANDTLELCARMPGSVVVIDVGEAPAEALRLLERLKLGRHDVSPIVVAQPEWSSLEWAAREAGAVDFHAPPPAPAALCRQCRQILGR